MRNHFYENEICENNLGKKDWLRKCAHCGKIGYDPNHIEKRVYPYDKLTPLSLDENGLCEVCAELFSGKKVKQVEPKVNDKNLVERAPLSQESPLINKFEGDRVIVSCDDVINGFNKGYIKRINFKVKDYSHYSNCVIQRNLSWTTLKIALDVFLTKDGREGFTFLNQFDENRKIFSMGKKGRFSFKQLWDKIEILDVEYF